MAGSHHRTTGTATETNKWNTMGKEDKQDETLMTVLLGSKGNRGAGTRETTVNNSQTDNVHPVRTVVHNLQMEREAGRDLLTVFRTREPGGGRIAEDRIRIARDSTWRRGRT